MPLPRQPFGLNKFSTSISSCPVSPDAVKAIVFQRNNLAVVNGIHTETELILSNFFSIINKVSKFSIIIPASDLKRPLDIYSVGDISDTTKVLAIIAKFEKVTEDKEYIEWTTANITDGTILEDMDPFIPSETDNTSFNINEINELEFGWGCNISYDKGNGPLWAASNGGLIKWDNNKMTLWNTLNSDIPSDYINTIEVDDTNGIWLGTNNGISYFNKEEKFDTHLTLSNSELLDNNIRDIKLLSVNNIAIASDKGMYIYNFKEKEWQVFNKYDNSLLYDTDINKIHVKDSLVYLGTSNGVCIYDTIGNDWNIINSKNITGWDAPNIVSCLDVIDNYLYIGTTDGLVCLDQTGLTASTYLVEDGMASNNIISINATNYEDEKKIYVGHDKEISILDVNSNTWNTYKTIINDEIDLPGATGATGATGEFQEIENKCNVRCFLPSKTNKNNLLQTIFFGSCDGIKKLVTPLDVIINVPEEDKSSDLLLNYPNRMGIYSSSQPLFFIFSKSIDRKSLQDNFILKDTLTTSICNTHGSNVTGEWEWSNDDKVVKFTPDVTLKSTPYEYSISEGVFNRDSTFLRNKISVNYYTEDIVPRNGWMTLGKLMILTGGGDKYVPTLYLRNPHDFDVTLEILSGEM